MDRVDRENPRFGEVGDERDWGGGPRRQCERACHGSSLRYAGNLSCSALWRPISLLSPCTSTFARSISLSSVLALGGVGLQEIAHSFCSLQRLSILLHVIRLPLGSSRSLALSVALLRCEQHVRPQCSIITCLILALGLLNIT